MRTKLSLFLIAFSVLGASPVPNDDIAAIIQDEYKKLQGEHSETNTRLRSRVQELVNARSKAIAESRKRAEMELGWADLVRKYSVVLASKYRDEDTGAYEPGMELSPKDLENVSKILGRYLNTQPLQGRVSAGEGRRQLDYVVRRLNELAKIHNNPTEENNSELEILAYQISDSDFKLRKTVSFAKSLGIELVDTAKDGKDRTPASGRD